MKKLFYSLAAVLCCALTTAVFTSCSKDSDDSSTETTKTVAYEVNYSYELPAQAISEKYGNLLDLCQKVKIGYVDENGKEQWDNLDLNTRKWSKAVKYTSSFSSYIKLHFIKKENVEYQFDAYRFNGGEANVSPIQTLYGIKGIVAIDSKGVRTEGALMGYKFNDHITSSSFIKYKEGTNGRNKLEDVFTDAFYVTVIDFSISF